MNSVEISKITIGPRCRKDLGDIQALAKSISEIGLLHPIVVTPQFELIAGRRRLEAMKLLGREKIPVTILQKNETTERTT